MNRQYLPDYGMWSKFSFTNSMQVCYSDVSKYFNISFWYLGQYCILISYLVVPFKKNILLQRYPHKHAHLRKEQFTVPLIIW